MHNNYDEKFTKLMYWVMLNYHMKRSLICDDERMKKNCTIHFQICIRKPPLKLVKIGQISH
jgi:hypothetical protein